MITQPLKWHGGKHYLASKIISLMPPHVHYVEPYFGGGSVLLQKSYEGISEVVNDINGELMNFWLTLQDEASFAVFNRRVEAMPLSSRQWELAHNQQDFADVVTRAVVFFVRIRQSRQGLGKDFATLSRNRTRRGMNEQASSWLTAVEGLSEVHERLKRVVILNDDAVNVIKQQDGENAFFYCDPPYVPESRSAPDVYDHEMTVEQHERLLDALSKIEGKFILSGYPSNLYDKWADGYGWRVVDVEIDNKASSKKVKDKKTERLWMNY